MRRAVRRVPWLWQKLEHLRSGPHGVNDELVAAVEHENNCLEQPAMCVESQSKLTTRRFVVKTLDPGRP